MQTRQLTRNSDGQPQLCCTNINYSSPFGRAVLLRPSKVSKASILKCLGQFLESDIIVSTNGYNGLLLHSRQVSAGILFARGHWTVQTIELEYIERPTSACDEIQHLSNYFLFRNFEPPQTRGTRISETTVRVSNMILAHHVQGFHLIQREFY